MQVGPSSASLWSCAALYALWSSPQLCRWLDRFAWAFTTTTTTTTTCPSCDWGSCDWEPPLEQEIVNCWPARASVAGISLAFFILGLITGLLLANCRLRGATPAATAAQPVAVAPPSSGSDKPAPSGAPAAPSAARVLPGRRRLIRSVA